MARPFRQVRLCRAMCRVDNGVASIVGDVPQPVEDKTWTMGSFVVMGNAR